MGILSHPRNQQSDPENRIRFNPGLIAVLPSMNPNVGTGWGPQSIAFSCRR
jgi:hypothetical protein